MGKTNETGREELLEVVRSFDFGGELKDIAIYYRMKLYISPSKTLKDNWD